MTDPAGRQVLLVDDHEVVRQGLRLLLQTVLGYRVREVAGGLEALASLEQESADVVLLDARMPERDGIWTLQRIREQHPDVPVLMLSTYDTAEYVDGALEHGASGYLLKDASSQQLHEAIETAVAGRGVYLHPQVAQRLLGRRRDVTATGGSMLQLSEREQGILALLVAGRSTEEIGEELHLAAGTVKSHLTSIFRKLDVANRTQAVAKALRAGLVDADRHH